MIRAFVLICLLFAGTTAQQPNPMPELSLPKLDGQTLRSADLKDKIIVLDFWATLIVGAGNVREVLKNCSYSSQEWCVLADDKRWMV